MNDTFETQVLSITGSQSASQSVRQVWGTSIPLHSKVQKKNRWTIALWTPSRSLSSGRYRRNIALAAAVAASQPTERDCEADPETDNSWTRGRRQGPHPPHDRGLDGTSTCLGFHPSEWRPIICWSVLLDGCNRTQAVCDIARNVSSWILFHRAFTDFQRSFK